MLRNSDGIYVAMGRSIAVTILDERGVERSSQRVAYGSKLFVDDGDKVKRGQRLAEWDPYTRPMMTEVEGVVHFEDLVDGISVLEATDESTGITKRQVIDWRSTPRGADLKPAIVIKDTQGNVLKVPRGGEARFQLSVDAILSVEPGQRVSQGDVLARSPMESAKTKDITGVCRVLPNCSKPVVRRITPSSLKSMVRSGWAAITRTSVALSSSRRKTVSSQSNT